MNQKIKIYAVPLLIAEDNKGFYNLDEADLMNEIEVDATKGHNYLDKREEAYIRLGRVLGADSNLVALRDDVYGVIYYYYNPVFGKISKIYGIDSLRRHLEKYSGCGLKGKLKL